MSLVGCLMVASFSLSQSHDSESLIKKGCVSDCLIIIFCI